MERQEVQLVPTIEQADNGQGVWRDKNQWASSRLPPHLVTPASLISLI